MITSTQITNTEIFAAVLVFKLLNWKGLFMNRQDIRNCYKSGLLLKKIAKFLGYCNIIYS